MLADEYVSYIALDKDQAIIISEQFFYWRKSEFSIYKCPWTHISHILYVADTGVQFILYRDTTHGSTFLIPITDKALASSVYTKLAKCAYLMGNSVALLPLNVAERAPGEVADYMSTYCRGLNLLGELDGYKFGSANHLSKRAIVESEGELLHNTQVRLAAPFENWASLDRIVWQLVAEWDGSHVGLNAARCTAALLINFSDNPIQLDYVHQTHGAGMTILNCVDYKSYSRTIMPRGSVLVFAWGHSPTPMESGAVKLIVSTDYFQLTISSEIAGTSVDTVGSHKVSFLEKSASQWWSKYVIHIA